MSKMMSLVGFIIFVVKDCHANLNIDYKLTLTEPTCITELQLGTSPGLINFETIYSSDFDSTGLATSKGKSFKLKLSKCDENNGRIGKIEIDGDNVSGLFRNDTAISTSQNTGFYLKYNTLVPTAGSEVVATKTNPFSIDISNYKGNELDIPFWVGVKKIDNTNAITSGVVKATISFNFKWK